VITSSDSADFEEVPRAPPSKVIRKPRKPRSPREVRERIDRHGKPKQRYVHAKVFADGNDVVILRVTEKGIWQRLPEPTNAAPTSGVPRFPTRPAAIAWLRGQGASMLGGAQVAVVRMMEVMFVEVVNRPKVSLLRRPKFMVDQTRQLGGVSENHIDKGPGAPPSDGTSRNSG